MFSHYVRENVICSALYSKTYLLLHIIVYECQFLDRCLDCVFFSFFPELTRKPTVMFYPMMEGQTSTMRCFADQLCSKRVNIRWRWTKADGQSITDLGVNHFYHRYSIFNVNPTADDHNTNITCVAEYDYSIVETTVTLTVKCKLLQHLFDLIWTILSLHVIAQSSLHPY